MHLPLLFYRLMARPLLREPVRTLLTISAIALGVAVVLAIDLAGDAATGSFRSSMETLSGDNDLEVTASGGVPEDVVGTLATLPYTVIVATKKSLPLIGLDLVAETSIYAQGDAGNTGATSIQSASDDVFEHLGNADSIWVGLSDGNKTGDHVELLINDQVRSYTVRGVYPDSNGNESAIVMDIAAAQRALNRFGRVDRILLKVPQTPSLEEWQQRLRTILTAGVEVRPQGSGTNENRRMLAGLLELSSFTTQFPFRWFAAARKLESCAPSAPAVERSSQHSSAKLPALGSRALSLGFHSAASWRRVQFS